MDFSVVFSWAVKWEVLGDKLDVALSLNKAAPVDISKKRHLLLNDTIHASYL